MRSSARSSAAGPPSPPNLLPDTGEGGRTTATPRLPSPLQGEGPGRWVDPGKPQAPPRAGTLPARLADELVYPILSGVPIAPLAYFFRQFTVLVGAGIPVGQALALREGQTTNRRLKAAIREARRRVEQGERLSGALAAHPGLFSALELAMIRAGEEGGVLPEMLGRIADYLEREIEFRRLMRRLTLYPKILLVVGWFVLPAVMSMLMGGNPLAVLIQPLLSLLQLGLIVFTVVAVSRLWLFRSEAARVGYEQVMWSMPGVGAAARKFALAKFGRALAALYAAGLPLPACLRVGAGVSGSRLLQRACEHAARAVEQGDRLTESLAATGVFPSVFVRMLGTGEATGDVDAMLVKAAEYLEAEAETRAQQCAYLFGELVYLLVVLMLLSGVRLFAWVGR